MNHELMRQLMQALRQTDEWDRVWKEDPLIVAAKSRLDAAMQKVGAIIPGKLFDELWDAIAEMDAANEYVSILYGIRVAATVREAITSTDDFTRYILNRKAGGGNGKDD